MRRSYLLFAGVFVTVLSASNVYALDMEYYTYNGFDAVVGAWQQTAMIFSNVEYAALFFSVIFAAILFGGVATYYKIFQGANVSPLSWALPIGFGVILYLGVFVPKATLHVYDPVLNRYQPVSGVPQGIVALAGTLNLVERGIVEIIEMSGAPLSYKQYAGGIGFDSLLKATGNLSMNDKYVEASTGKYITDCLYFELNRPGTSLMLTDIMNNTGTLLSLFGEAANPAVYTVWYDSANQGGTTMSCTDAYVKLNSYFSDPLKVDSLVRAKCANAGFNPDNANELVQCKQALGATVEYATGNSISAEKFFQQTVLAQQLSYAATTGGIDETIKMKSSINSMSSMYGAGMQANEWIPLVRAVVTAVAIGLLPVLVIFIPTGIGNKALAMITGFFIWVTFWGVTDTIIHQLATNYAYTFFEQARQNNIGYASIMAMPDAAAKSLALFGLIRWLGMMLSTAITIKIANFVDAHSLSMIGGQLSGSVQQQGEIAGTAAKIEGTAEAVSGPIAASATMANAHKWDHWQRVGAQANEQAHGIGSGLGYGNRDFASQVGSQRSEQSVGGALQDARMASALGGLSQRELGQFRQHGLITDRMATSIGRSLGLNAEQSKKLLTGMKVNHHDLSVNQDTGGLMLTHGEVQSADGSKTVGGGMVTEQRTLSSRQLLDKADELEKLGHVEAAGGIRRLVSSSVKSSGGHHHGTSEPGKGLLANESATLIERKSFDGKIAETSVRHGSDVSWFDTSSHRRGRTIREGADVDRGDHTSLGSTLKLDNGTHIPPQTAAQMALEGNPLLVSQTTKPGRTDAERDAQRLAVAAAVADGMGSLITRRGFSEDYSGVDGSMGAGIPDTKIGGSVSTGYRTSDQYNASLMGQHYNEVLKSAEQEAISKRLSAGDTNVLMSQRLQTAVQEEKKYFEEHGKWSYGATGTAERAGNAIKDSVHLRDMKDIDPKELSIDTDTMLD